MTSTTISGRPGLVHDTLFIIVDDELRRMAGTADSGDTGEGKQLEKRGLSETYLHYASQKAVVVGMQPPFLFGRTCLPAFWTSDLVKLTRQL